jgi:predicted GTPase
MPSRRILILGAAGRDFHDFNVAFRGDPDVDVVAFTATQIPNIEGRRYPAELAGPRYPAGIPILDEDDLERAIRDLKVDDVVFSYSDVSHETVMHLASRAIAAGAGFRLLGPAETMLQASVPVVSVCAVRTGCGKSQTTRRVAEILEDAGLRVVSIRHPMPYGDLAKQRVQRFAELADLDRHDCTIEEREEYEPHIARGGVIYAGVDYGAILVEAEREADVILWDGGNNDLPFYRSNLEIVVADPHRAGHETAYHPGEANLRRADVVVLNKMGTAPEGGAAEIRATLHALNPEATVIEADSPCRLHGELDLRGKRVLVIEDGPTLTHGGMAYGAGVVAAREAGVAECVDPRPHAVGSIRDTFAAYPATGAVLPAMGYGGAQVRDLAATVRATPCDAVIIGTPIDLTRLIEFEQPTARVTYDLAERGSPNLRETLARVFPAVRARTEDGATAR